MQIKNNAKICFLLKQNKNNAESRSLILDLLYLKQIYALVLICINWKIIQYNDQVFFFGLEQKLLRIIRTINLFGTSFL